MRVYSQPPVSVTKCKLTLVYRAQWIRALPVELAIHGSSIQVNIMLDTVSSPGYLCSGTV